MKPNPPDMFDSSNEPATIQNGTPKNSFDLAWRILNSRRLVNILILAGVVHLNYLAMTGEKKDAVKDFIIKSYYRMNMAEMFLKETDDSVQRLDHVFEKHKIPMPEPYVYGSENDKVDELVGILRRIEASRMRPSPATQPKKIKPKPRPKPRPKKKVVKKPVELPPEYSIDDALPDTTELQEALDEYEQEQNDKNSRFWRR